MACNDLQGKIAIVTGSASGIGAATAKKLAENGAIVSLIDVDEEGLHNVAKQCASISSKYNNPAPFVFIGDLTSDSVRQKFVDETVRNFGQIDILINNAGIFGGSSIFDTSLESADKLFNILLRVPYDMCRLTANHLIKTEGCIVNVASISAVVVTIQNPAYHAAKAALVQLTRCLADEFGPHKVRVNGVSPGSIRTNISKSIVITPQKAVENKKVNVIRESEEKCALKRVGKAEEVANVIGFLVSSESSYMTGSDVLVDGGMMAMHRF